MTAILAPAATTTGIACAKCSHWSNGRRVVVHHANVAAVRACCANQVQAPTMDALNAAWAAAKIESAELERQQELAAYEAKSARDDANPWPSSRDAIKPGRYAIERDGVIKFYKIDKPSEGRWAGRTFVNVMASDELHAVRSPAERSAILNAIAIDPAEAMRRYGREIGRCGHCGRTLTDATSRANGIGPICAEKGW